MSALTAQNLYDLTSAVALVTGGGEHSQTNLRQNLLISEVSISLNNILSSLFDPLLGTGIGLMCAKALAANGAKVCEWLSPYRDILHLRSLCPVGLVLTSYSSVSALILSKDISGRREEVLKEACEVHGPGLSGSLHPWVPSRREESHLCFASSFEDSQPRFQRSCFTWNLKWILCGGMSLSLADSLRSVSFFPTFSIKSDVSSKDDVQALAKHIEQQDGKLHILVKWVIWRRNSRSFSHKRTSASWLVHNLSTSRL